MRRTGSMRPSSRILPKRFDLQSGRWLTEAQALGERVTRRRQVIEMMVAERNRVRLVRQKRIQKAIERHLALLQKELSEIDHDIDDAIRQSPV
jgi:transposase